MPTAEKWWNEELQLLDPDCQVVWGNEGVYADRYGLERWLVVRRVPEKELKEWNETRARFIRLTKVDVIGPALEYEMQLEIETPEGEYRPFGRDILQWMKDHDVWRKYRSGKERGLAVIAAQKKLKEDLQERDLQQTKEAYKDAGFREVINTAGDLEITTVETSRPITKVMAGTQV